MSDAPNNPPSGGQQPPPPGGQQPPPPGSPQPPPASPQPPPVGGPPPPVGGPPPPGQPPAAPQFSQPAAGIGGPADLGTRVLARLIDSILIAVVNAVLVTTLIFGVIFGAGTGVGNFGFGGFSGWGLLSSVIGAAIYVGYFAFMESSKGQTVGKMLLKLQTQGPDGGNPTMEQALKRNAWMALSIIPIVGGLLQLGAAIYIMVTINNNTATRQGWHDEFADGTRVIKIG